MTPSNTFCFLVMVMSTFLWLSPDISSFVSAQTQGVATFYTPPYQPSACYGFQDEGVMIAAASEALWGGGAACGDTYQVTCIGGTNLGTPHPCIDGAPPVIVKIVDFCPPPGCQGTIDLSEEAFASIADTNSGSINMEYQLL